jgi:hypothetical protein
MSLLVNSSLGLGHWLLVASSLKGAAVRLFKHPCPVSYCLFMQRVGLFDPTLFSCYFYSGFFQRYSHLVE